MKNKIFISPTKEYRLIKLLRSQAENKFPSIGIYEDKRGEKYIIKTLNYTAKNNFYSQLMQEVDVFKTFNGSKNKILNFPKLIEVIHGDKNVSMITEFIEGKKLSEFSNRFSLNAISAILKSFDELPSIRTINKKKHIDVLITFPVYLLILLLKDYKNLPRYLRLGVLFFKNYSFSYNNSRYVFAHRDLHVDNIIVSNDKLFIIDPEVAMFAEKETDLAILVRPFAKRLGSDLDLFLQTQLKSHISRKRFIGLVIYYAVQIMAIRPKNWDDYLEAETYLSKYFFQTKEKLLNKDKKSIAEIVYFLGLKIISIFNKYLKFGNNGLPIILCYHSISDDNWRFSVDVKEFKKQISYLDKNKSIVSLSEIIKPENDRKNLISITFDDGYENIHKNVLPLFKKLKLKGTLFLLSNPDKPNRDELKNNLPLLSESEVKDFIKAGWEIGCHTGTHSDLRSLSSKELEKEIVISKKKLEQKYSIKVKYFAYPMGEYSSRVIDIVKKAGFEEAFSTDGGTVNTKDKFKIDRICIEGKITENQFKALITPLGIQFNKAYVQALKFKESLNI